MYISERCREQQDLGEEHAPSLGLDQQRGAPSYPTIGDNRYIALHQGMHYLSINGHDC